MPEATRELAMFPLGSALLPGMPLPLRVFEPRYVALLSTVLGADREFGVVLIERGSEVGGGDARFRVGTVASIVTVQIGEGSIVLVARGTERFEVVDWLEEDPFPRARVRELAPLVIEPGDLEALAAAERLVRDTLARHSEFVELRWPADVQLSDDPAERLWQLAGIAPIGSLDQQALLRSATAAELIARLVEETRAAGDSIAAGWTGDPDDDEQ
ncbi:LON peptidase substrate-binding domain-containing protein [Pengzhenrongella frigida]|uniref:Peptidase S16 n=1 Tax=Pengzhenrongella frigida TaxID=1259133 RepID=A0A4Q5N1V2_9MICO|nr:LON peptidase substrate-binding domain-containing protein [Cellulomonas sp. HLT2-17]RYV52036.1 peptidase S16 [Cellulomonas sp. HLT2-17]